MDQVENSNQAIFVTLNARPGTAHWMLATAEAIANHLIYLVPLALVAMWLWGVRRQRAVALEACLVTGLACACHASLAAPGTESDLVG